MESSQIAQTIVPNQKKSSLTPRELIKFHIENPDQPITDEDILNLKLDYQTMRKTNVRDFYLPED